MRIPIRLLKSEWPPNEGVMSGDQRFDAILDSMRENGQRDPVTINLGWFVIDGMHRLSAARLLGWDSVDVRVWTGTEFVA